MVSTAFIGRARVLAGKIVLVIRCQLARVPRQHGGPAAMAAVPARLRRRRRDATWSKRAQLGTRAFGIDVDSGEQQRQRRATPARLLARAVERPAKAAAFPAHPTRTWTSDNPLALSTTKRATATRCSGSRRARFGRITRGTGARAARSACGRTRFWRRRGVAKAPAAAFAARRSSRCGEQCFALEDWHTVAGACAGGLWPSGHAGPPPAGVRRPCFKSCSPTSRSRRSTTTIMSEGWTLFRPSRVSGHLSHTPPARRTFLRL